jgi:AcrR family transcriptional regulator
MAPKAKTINKAKPGDDTNGGAPVRQRILEAAFAAFMARGFAATSTLEIATRAKVSKRALYDEVGNKNEMLVACIAERARRLKIPADLPEPRDRAALKQILSAFGAQLLRETTDPAVVAVYRLAAAEAITAPAVARALDTTAIAPTRAALREIMSRARTVRLLDGDTSEMAECFAGLLWGSLMVHLLLQVAERPTSREITRRAEHAADALLRIYAQPPPEGDTPSA